MLSTLLMASPAIMIMLKPGKSYRLLGFKPNCDRHYRHKLLAMGFIPGTTFHALRVAPMGDPMEIKIKGFLVSLRHSEIKLLKVEEL